MTTTTTMKVRLASLCLLGVSVSFATSAAAAETTSADPTTDAAKMCSTEEGQRIRGMGKLREAGTFFLTCREQCAYELHRECERNAQETFAAMPTLMIMAKDSRGNDLSTDVSVSIDGNVVASEIDGKALAVNPGPHTVTVTRKGVTLSQMITATEGSKNMPVKVMFKGHDPDAPARDLGGHTIWPWAVVALGVAGVASGIAIVATAPDLPDGCDKETKVCQPRTGETASSTSFEQRRDDAGAATDQPKVGGIIIGLGAAVIIGGIVWHFIEPTEARTGKAKVTPWSAKNSQGFAVSF